MDKLSLTEILKATQAETDFTGEIFFSGVTTDSRKIVEGSLFVALKGENFNGEDFAQDAIKKGAAAVLVSKGAKNISGIALKVDDTLTAYQQIAASWRSRFNIPVVAITGSSGKTTTKDLTAAVLSGLGKVCKTAANFNNEIGVPMTLLELDVTHKAAVVEIGMRGLHQIETLARYVKPTIGTVINVNETHIEILGSVENIARAKAELVEAIPSGGTVILNADNPYTLNMKNLAASGVKVITYALKNPADLTAENISIDSGATEFTLNYGGARYDFEIPIIGRHNVSNALAAVAAGLSVGLTIDEIKRGISSLVTTRMRFEVIRRDGIIIVNDAYNASPASMRASIKTVAEIYASRKIAVLADMLELGEISKKAHREIGAELAANNFDTLIVLGELGKFIADGARDAGLKNIFVAENHENAAKKVHAVQREGDVILFKASHGMHLEKVIELI
ncbi:MAG: UDP-N-acetylmuramoyl-tripeptide--D-alanyl-D-alanine ligase [Selenomonadaceae bacterium]|nr:UDP-N-acetylmuramoyl-tripeptide--D-alanyl-D-alanine ligase [Selenomonadaceae bacterium]